MKRNKIIRYILERVTELAMMLLLVSLAFAVFTVLLFQLFPLGITLSQVLERRSGMDRSEWNSYGGGMFGDAKRAGAETAAILAYLGNDVRSKGAASIAWGPAQLGMKLRNQDAVQTLAQSSAQINFDSSNYLTMGSNSLIIIRRVETEPSRNERRTAIVVVDGQLQGHVATSGMGALSLNITTPSAAVRMQPGFANGPRSDFKISVNADHSSTIVVLRGQAEVSAQGKTVRVTRNTGVTVKQGEAPTAAIPLPAPPDQSHPAEGTVVGYRELPQRVVFRWASGDGDSRYHLQLAKDCAFKEVVMDKELGEAQFSHGNLRKGIYFWRVSRIDGGIEGMMSKALRFEVVQNTTAPPLTVTFPSGPVAEERCVVVGATSPGNKVFVAGNPVPTDASGAFRYEMPIKPGPTLVTVEAVDAAGNVSYRSGYVQGRL